MSVAPVDTDPIKHVIVLMLENRSFDQMLGDFKTKYPQLNGVDRNNWKSNPDWPGSTKRFTQAESRARVLNPGPYHETKNVLAQINKRPGLNQCEGFVFDYALSNGVETDAQLQEVMNFYAKGALPALHALAEHYLICDRWHASVVGPTWTNRFFMHTGTSIGLVKMPTGLSIPYHTYTQTTLYDRLNEAKRSWKIYFGDTPQSLLLVNQHHPENLKRYFMHDDFFDDLRTDDFPDYAFIEPNYSIGQNDYHPPSDVLAGEAFLSKIYNAIRSSPIWHSTLFIVVFDEHGGFYDHEYPPEAVPPDDHTDEHPFVQYRVRVPAILISPYVKEAFTHTLYDHTSILKYLTEKWGLGSLGRRVSDPKTNSIGKELQTTPRGDDDLLDHIPATLPNSVITETIGDPPVLVLDANQTAMVNFTAHLETSLTPAEVRELRQRMIREGPNGQLTVAMDRVREYLDQHRS
jgi:phospholipase C